MTFIYYFLYLFILIGEIFSFLAEVEKEKNEHGRKSILDERNQNAERKQQVAKKCGDAYARRN